MLKLDVCSADRLRAIAQRGCRNRIANGQRRWRRHSDNTKTPHLRIYIRAQIKDQNKTTHFIMDIKYLDSQIRKKKPTHSLWLLISACANQKSSLRAQHRQPTSDRKINVPACSCLLQKHLWHISCSSGIVRPLVKSLPLVCAGLYLPGNTTWCQCRK